MYKPEEIEGKKFGYLTAIKYSGNGKWECKCDCGNIKCVETSKLVKGRTVSCGCKNKLNQFKKTHGMTNTRIYSIWSGMKNRCQNMRKQGYEMYGGRGIVVCDEWNGKHGFENFYEWSMKHGYSEELTIDRIDNDKGYSPDNCRWVTMEIQNKNKRNVRHFVIDGIDFTVPEISKTFGINLNTLNARIRRHGNDLSKVLPEITNRNSGSADFVCVR